MGKPLTISYRSTHHYLVDCRNGKLLVDAGWAGSLPELRHGLRRYDIELPAIKYVMMTHHHPDHAGLTQEVKQAAGARLLIHERQVPYLQDLLAFYLGKSGQGQGSYVPILIERDDLVIAGSGRETLRSIGIQGQLAETPGHSDDSISLVLDDGSAFIGDLPLPNQVGVDKYETVRDSWRKLISLQAQTAYHAHAGPIPVRNIVLGEEL